MCIFAEPVRHVAKTRIAVLTDGEEGNLRFTAYQMAVDLLGRGNAMILPVPCDKGIGLVDMSGCKDFFKILDRLWPEPVTRGMTKGISNDGFLGMRHLEVHKVGSYEVSVAGEVDDIRRVDPSVFNLSLDTEAILRANYPQGFSFVVAKLTQGGEIHPLGYTYDAANPGEVFVPTRHGHGEELSAKSVFAGLPEWDHTVYIQGADFVMPGSEPGHTHVEASRVPLNENQRVLGELTSKVPELEGFLSARRRVNRIKWHGRLQNLDVRMAA